MAVRQIAAPLQEPVAPADVLSWGRIDAAEDGAVLGIAIQQAREEAEHATGRRLMTQTWEIDVLAGDVVELWGLSPVQSIQQSGVAVPWTDGLPPTCTAPADGVLTVVCGWSDAASVPAGIRLWIIHRVISSAEVRQFLLPGQFSAPPRPFVDGLLDPYRVPVA